MADVVRLFRTSITVVLVALSLLNLAIWLMHGEITSSPLRIAGVVLSVAFVIMWATERGPKWLLLVIFFVLFIGGTNLTGGSIDVENSHALWVFFFGLGAMLRFALGLLARSVARRQEERGQLGTAADQPGIHHRPVTQVALRVPATTRHGDVAAKPSVDAPCGSPRIVEGFL